MDQDRRGSPPREPLTTATSLTRPGRATRVIRGHARRIADGDIDGLADLLRLSRELETAIQQAVTGLRGFEYSWADTAAQLGTTRQAAQQRWGH